MNYHYVWIGNSMGWGFESIESIRTGGGFSAEDQVIIWFYIEDREQERAVIERISLCQIPGIRIVGQNLFNLIEEEANPQLKFQIKYLFSLGFLLGYNNLVKEFAVPYIFRKTGGTGIFLDFSVLIERGNIKNLVQETFANNPDAKMLLPQIVKNIPRMEPFVTGRSLRPIEPTLRQKRFPNGEVMLFFAADVDVWLIGMNDPSLEFIDRLLEMQKDHAFAFLSPDKLQQIVCNVPLNELFFRTETCCKITERLLQAIRARIPPQDSEIEPGTLETLQQTGLLSLIEPFKDANYIGRMIIDPYHEMFGRYKTEITLVPSQFRTTHEKTPPETTAIIDLPAFRLLKKYGSSAWRTQPNNLQSLHSDLQMIMHRERSRR